MPEMEARANRLAVVAYPDQETAEQALASLSELQRDDAINLADAVVVTRSEDGRVELHESGGPEKAAAVGGAIWGGAIGLALLAPLLGIALGAAAGASAAKAFDRDLGIKDGFMEELGEKLEPGGAALFVLTLGAAPDEALSRLALHGGHVLYTSLPQEAEARLRRALEA
jgi:uncharacterized membrane protein